MNLLKPLSFLLTSVVFLGTAMAADSAASAESGQFRMPIVQGGGGAFSMIAPGGKANPSFIVHMARGQRIDLNRLASVCFTMRTYKVKPTERLRNNESGWMGYSTCRMGSNYKVRSADEPPVKLK